MKHDAILCPFCGTAQFSRQACTFCHKRFGEKSRKEAQIEMGPWYVRNKTNPYAAGWSYAMMKKMAANGVLNAKSVVRGPSTRQFWLMAKFTPGISHLIGSCYACPVPVRETDTCCTGCGAPFSEYPNRNALGLRYATQEEAQAALAELEATSVSPRTGLHNDRPSKPSPLAIAPPQEHPHKQAIATRQAVVESGNPNEKPFVPGADLLDQLFGA